MDVNVPLCIQMRCGMHRARSSSYHFGEAALPLGGTRASDQLSDRRALQNLFKLGERIIQLRMHRTQCRTVLSQSQRTCRNALDRINGVDDIQNGDIGRRLGERNAAAGAPLRLHDARLSEQLQHLGQVRWRNLSGPRDQLSCLCTGVAIGQKADGPQRIFGSL